MRPSISSITTIAIALGLALAGCGGPTKTAGPPAPEETPPTTKDPGAVMDEQPLQPAPPPTPETRGTGAGSGSAADPRGGPDGATCFTAGDCASGICEGEGCTADRPGHCAPRSRACTRDLRPYCGCDGVTFRASGSCPGRRYAATGTCK